MTAAPPGRAVRAISGAVILWAGWAALTHVGQHLLIAADVPAAALSPHGDAGTAVALVALFLFARLLTLTLPALLLARLAYTLIGRPRPKSRTSGEPRDALPPEPRPTS